MALHCRGSSKVILACTRRKYGPVPRNVPERAALDVAITLTTTSRRFSWMRSNREIAKITPDFPLRLYSLCSPPRQLRHPASQAPHFLAHLLQSLLIRITNSMSAEGCPFCSSSNISRVSGRFGFTPTLMPYRQKVLIFRKYFCLSALLAG